MVMGVFVWTIDDVIAVVGVGIILLAWLGVLVVSILSGVGERILRRGEKSIEEQCKKKEDDHGNTTETT